MSIAVKSRKEELLQKIKSCTAFVGVIGLGYVGLPTAFYKVEEGYMVTGFDVSEEKVTSINDGVSYINDIKTADLTKLVAKNKLRASTNFRLLKDMDVIVVCVPTPINEYKEPNLNYVREVSHTIAENIAPSTLVILESTTYPATTEEILIPALESKGFKVGKDVFVSYSPERIDPANKKFNLHNTAKVVGGYTEHCMDLAVEFIGEMAHPVSSLKVAEMSKVYENTFRYINMAFVNEMTVLCNKLGIDIWEVIEASGTKPYGFMKFTPWIGVGGHCIPVDPYYLTYKAKEYGQRTKMIELAGEINDHMIDFTYYRILEVLNDKEILLKKANVVLLGASYKENIADVRESPVLNLLSKLKVQVNNLAVMDPYVSEVHVNNDILKVSSYNKQLIQKADVVILTTAHELFPYEEIAENATTILDTKNAFSNKNIIASHIIKL